MCQRDIDEINSACAKRGICNPVRWLLRIGFVRPHHQDPTNRLRWPFSVAPRWLWSVLWRTEPAFGFFRNGIFIRDVGTWLPRRWGVRFWIFEFGQRG